MIYARIYLNLSEREHGVDKAYGQLIKDYYSKNSTRSHELQTYFLEIMLEFQNPIKIPELTAEISQFHCWS